MYEDPLPGQQQEAKGPRSAGDLFLKIPGAEHMTTAVIEVIGGPVKKAGVGERERVCVCV